MTVSQVSGTSGGSFTARMLQAEKLDPMMEECIKWSAFGIFAGGSHLSCKRVAISACFSAGQFDTVSTVCEYPDALR